MLDDPTLIVVIGNGVRVRGLEPIMLARLTDVLKECKLDRFTNAQSSVFHEVKFYHTHCKNSSHQMLSHQMRTDSIQMFQSVQNTGSVNGP